MYRLMWNLLKVGVIVTILTVALTAILQVLLYLGTLFGKYYLTFVDSLLTNYTVRPELTIGITTVLLFVVLPITIFVTQFERYWADAG